MTKQSLYNEYPNLTPTISYAGLNTNIIKTTKDVLATKDSSEINITNVDDVMCESPTNNGICTTQQQKQSDVVNVDVGLCAVSPSNNISQWEESASSISVNSGQQRRVTYNDLIREVTSLCQVVQNSQEHAKHVMSTIKDWKQRIQMKHNFRLHFLELPTSQPQDVALNTVGNELKTPLRGAVQGPQGRCRKRLKSRHEAPSTTTNIKSCVPPNIPPPH